MENETLLKLEAVVQKMLGNINELKLENNSLELQVREKKNRIAELESELAAVNTDQEDISSRVSSLINSIEEWEKNGAGVDSENNEKSEVSESVIEASEAKQEAKLFDMGE